LRIVVGGSVRRSGVGGHGVKPRYASRAQRCGSALAAVADGCVVGDACEVGCPLSQALSTSITIISGNQAPHFRFIARCPR